VCSMAKFYSGGEGNGKRRQGEQIQYTTAIKGKRNSKGPRLLFEGRKEGERGESKEHAACRCLCASACEEGDREGKVGRFGENDPEAHQLTGKAVKHLPRDRYM